MKIELDLTETDGRVTPASEVEKFLADLEWSDAGAWVARRIRAQLPKPKPEEPTGLGAVVEDDRGERYVRLGTAYSPWFGGRYIPSVGQQRPWSDINAVRVLSEGVS